MNRNFKGMLLAALAVTAFGALASAAQATQFTAPGAAAGATTILNTTRDGTGKTSHHSFVVGNAAGTSTVSLTCEVIIAWSEHSHFIGPANEDVTITPKYGDCNAAGQAVTVTNTGCIFTFTANGEIHVTNKAAKVCAHGAGNAPIDIEFTGCKIEVGAQTLKGVKYHNLTAAGATVGSNEGSKVTVEPVVSGITYNAAGANCPYGTTSNGSFTTGNTIVTGTRPAGTVVEVRWDS